jgi:AraC-like DNA-binding protein
MYPHVHRAAPPSRLDDVHALTPFVSEVWSARLAPGQRHRVVPDGCIDLVFRDGAHAELFWVGPMTRAETVSVDAPACFLGVRFRPGVAPAFVGVDARELLDREVPENDACLLDALIDARCETARRDLLLAAVARRRAAAPDSAVVSAAAAILDAGGALRVADLARRAGLSERTLHRRFLAGVGYGPKQLCRIARLGVARALAARGVGGADLAAEAGYFDQAHLCHEVASFGLTPASLAR